MSKRIILTLLATLTFGTVLATAGTTVLYTNKTGQIFDTPGEGRAKIIITQEDTKTVAKVKNDTPLFAKASKIKLSGTHYLGFVNKNVGTTTTNNFEMRRNYVQVKAYVLDDSKSYFRVTLDSTYSNDKQADGDGHADVYVKYAYLYLNEVLPYTGVEFGMVHRPWIDYEEHQGWWMRSISKVFVEAGEAGHLTNSADLGFNFKTKTPYFTSELGVFNGEGYHGTNDNNGANGEDIGDGVSAEWRATVAILGNGEKKRKPLKDSYFDASFYGQYNMENSHNADDGTPSTYLWYGVHSVYNTPSFLIAGQYVISSNEQENGGNGVSDWEGQGFSVNSTYRFGDKKQFSVLARYDYWENQNTVSDAIIFKEHNIIYGLAWQQNKNFKWLLSGQTYDKTTSSDKDYTSAMLTAEVHW